MNLNQFHRSAKDVDTSCNLS